jgi:creatinine amidohydrolase/Fe(II)-dependent formamide hydrolase-like protein
MTAELHLAVRGPVGFSRLPADLSAGGAIGNRPTATPERGNAYVEATVEKLSAVLQEIDSVGMPTLAGESR